MPKLSFVMPTHNRIAWMPRCLETLQDQTEKDIEIIVVNDASSDGTKEFLDSYCASDPRIKVIHNETNQGAGKSRNIGMEAATSELIAVCDDDDEYPEDRAAMVLSWFAEHPESELVTYPYMRIGYFGEHLEMFWGAPFDMEAYEKNQAMGYFSNPSCAYKKKSAQEMGGYPSETKEMTDDFQFVTNWLKSGKKIDFDIRAVGVLHRVLPTSIMAAHRGWKPEWVQGKKVPA